ncbi:unnamed protein product [Parajaminaea phylloscopi]
MVKQLPSDAELQDFIRSAVRKDHEDNGEVTTTVRKIRHAAAERFGVSDEDLRSAKHELIKRAASEAAEAIERAQGSVTVTPDESSASQGGDDDGDDDDDRAQPAAQPAQEDDDFSSLDDSDGDDKERRRGRGSARGKSKGTGKQASRQQSTSSSSAAERGNSAQRSSADDEVARLKKFVVACGVRKQWNKWFQGLDPPAESAKAQAKALRELLAELGMGTGRMSMDRAKKIKEKRDFNEELEAIGVVPDGGGRSSRAASSSKQRRSRGANAKDSDGSDDEDDDDEPKPSKRPKFSASLMAFAAELNSSDDE